MLGKENGLGQHVAGLKAILAKRKQASISDEDDGDTLEESLAKTPRAEVQPPQTKAPPKRPTLKGPKKRPAAAKPTSPPSMGSSSSIVYPGTSRAPLVYGNSKVYFCKTQFRLMERIRGRQDVAYSFKVKDPKEVWKTLAKRLKELNP